MRSEPCPSGGGPASRTRISTVNRAVASTVVLTAASTVGALWAIVALVPSRNFVLILAYAIVIFVLLLRGYSATIDLRRQLRRHIRRNSELAWRYNHLWFICKQPHLCPRCKGWLAGVGAVIGGWFLATSFYGFQPSSVVHILTPGGAALVSGVCLFATPLHGVIGRLRDIRKDSFWESEYALGGIGFMSAFAAPLLVGVLFYLAGR